MSKINEKLVQDIQAILAKIPNADTEEFFDSKGVKRMLEMINDDEEFRSEIESSVDWAFRALEQARSYDYSGLDRERLLRAESRISLLVYKITSLKKFKFYCDKEERTSTVIREFVDLRDRIQWMDDFLQGR